MSVFTSLGIIIMAALIVAFLQLVPGVFAIFYHSASGKYTRKKASDLALFFILGTEAAVTIAFLCVYTLLTALYAVTAHLNILMWVLCGIFFALSIITLFFYFKKGPGTKLFIPRSLAQNFHQKAAVAKNRSDAFTLGFISILPEILFTTPLLAAIAVQAIEIDGPTITRASIAMLFIFVAILPLLIIKWQMTRHNLAEYLKFRFHNKNFFRTALCLSYLILAILTIIKATS